MKRFLIRCLWWILVLFGLEGAMYLTGFRFQSFNGLESYRSIGLSKKKTGKSLLILGDSAGRQLYPSQRTYPDAVSLSCNQAVTMAGQFFLMRNYFEANADALPQRVVFVCTPLCLENDLDQFSYQYFLKPFFTRDYKPLFSERLMDRVRQIPHYRSSRLPFVRVSNYAFAYDLEPGATFNLVSPLSREYLGQMVRLAFSKGVSFTLVCAPVRESLKEDVLARCAQSEANGELDMALLESYRNSIRAYPDSLFCDDLHFFPESIPDDPYHLFDQP